MSHKLHTPHPDPIVEEFRLDCIRILDESKNCVDPETKLATVTQERDELYGVLSEILERYDKPVIDGCVCDELILDYMTPALEKARETLRNLATSEPGK